MSAWLDTALTRLPGFIRCNSDHTVQAYRMVAMRILDALEVEPTNARRDDLLAALCTAALWYRGSTSSTMPRRIISVGLRMINTVWGEMYNIIDCTIVRTELRAWYNTHLAPHEALWLTQNALDPTPTDCDRVDMNHVRHFTNAEIQAMQAACSSSRDTLMLELLLTTGIRIGALCSIAWRNVDLRERSVRVLEKGRRVRDLHMHTSLLSAFEAHGSQRGPYVFPSRRGQAHLTARHMRTLFYQLASRAGLQGPHVHPHTCRHTVVQRLWYAGNSLDRIARFLGHESPTTTGKYYLHLAHRELISHMVIPWLTLKDREDLPVDVRHHNHTQEHALGNKTCQK